MINEQGLSKEMRIRPAALQNAEPLQDLQLHFAQNSESCSSQGLQYRNANKQKKKEKETDIIEPSYAGYLSSHPRQEILLVHHISSAPN